MSPPDEAARVAAMQALMPRLGGSARPADRALLARAMADGRVPAELGVLYQACDGLTLAEVDVWDLPDLLAYANADAIAREYPGGRVFGWNRSDTVFLIDAADTLHAGAGAIFALDGIYVGLQSAVLCAPALADFLVLAQGGARPWRGEPLLRAQADRLAELLAADPERVDTRPPLEDDALFEAAEAAGIELTTSLIELYRLCDGLRFARSGLRIDGVRDLSPVPGGEGAIRLGYAPGGPRLILTGEAGPRPSDLVLQVEGEGDDLAAAPAFGRLLATLIHWLDDRTERAP